MAHPDANIIFGTVVDEAMGDTVRVTVIAAGFDRWEAEGPRPSTRPVVNDIPDVFAEREPAAASTDDDEDEFDVPSFLK